MVSPGRFVPGIASGVCTAFAAVNRPRGTRRTFDEPRPRQLRELRRFSLLRLILFHEPLPFLRHHHMSKPPDCRAPQIWTALFPASGASCFLSHPRRFSMRAARSAAFSSRTFWSLPSIMTRTRGSVPEARTRTRPCPSKKVSTALTASRMVSSSR